MHDLPKTFGNWLTSDLAISEKTRRNYLSDFSHFTGWAILRLKTEGLAVNESADLLPHITPAFLEQYKHFQLSNNVPASTINRRLVTLRHFGRFLHELGMLDFDPTDSISNLTIEDPEKEKLALLSEFRKHLESEGASPKTIKNYLSDVRGFLEFLEFEI